MDNGKKRINAYEDIHQLIQWIRTQSTFELDANRILMFGGSYGGHVALYMATHYNDEITATASYYGISNFVTFLKNTEPYRRNLRPVVYGDETDSEQLKFLQEFSPIHLAEKITKPLFLLHGRNDHRVPCSGSEQSAAKIRGENPAADVWLLTFPGEGHGLVKRENRETRNSLSWLSLSKILCLFKSKVILQDVAEISPRHAVRRGTVGHRHFVGHAAA